MLKVETMVSTITVKGGGRFWIWCWRVAWGVLEGREEKELFFLLFN